MTYLPRHEALGPAVFVVNDDAAVLHSLAFSLGVDGYDVSTYSTEAALLEAASQVRGGCLVIDHHLPDTNGIDLARRLRSLGVNVPVILTANHPTADVLQQAAAEGISVIEKPLHAGVLAAAIRAAISQTPSRTSVGQGGVPA